MQPVAVAGYLTAAPCTSCSLYQVSTCYTWNIAAAEHAPYTSTAPGRGPGWLHQHTDWSAITKQAAYIYKYIEQTSMKSWTCALFKHLLAANTPCQCLSAYKHPQCSPLTNPTQIPENAPPLCTAHLPATKCVACQQAATANCPLQEMPK